MDPSVFSEFISYAILYVTRYLANASALTLGEEHPGYGPILKTVTDYLRWRNLKRNRYWNINGLTGLIRYFYW